MKNKIALFFCLILTLDLFASLDTKFYNINSMYGISMRKITSISKDEKGFIWGASKMGILRVTEGDCRIYQLPYIATDIVSVNLIYSYSGLYAYTNNGQLFRYDKLHDQFTLFTNLREYIDDKYLSVYKIIGSDDGCLWMACTRGLYKLKNDTMVIAVETGNQVRNILFSDNESLIYTTDTEIKQINIKTKKTCIIYNSKVGIDMNISSLLHDKKSNRLWVGTFSSGLHFINLETKKQHKIAIPNFPRQPILALEANTDSTYLVGIDGKGVWELNREGDAVLNVYKENIDNPSSLQGDGVYDILCDENNRVWVSTYSGGLSFFEQKPVALHHITHQINQLNSLVNNNVNRVIEDRDDNIWFATNNGISRWDRENNKWDTFLHNKLDDAQAFLSLCEDNDGNIWAGTYSSGIYILNGKTGRQMNHFNPEDTSSESPCKFIFDIFKDSQGDIWIGGIESNVLCYLAKEKRFRSYPKLPVNSFHELTSGKVLGTCSHGLLLFDKNSGKVKTMLDGYIVLDCAILNNDIWIATAGDGLLKYNIETNEIKQYTTKSGILSNYINSIIYSNGNLILGTENGLCKYNIADNSVYTYPSIFSFSKLSYNTSARCGLKSGEFVWGTNNGAIIFDPTTFFNTKLKGKIYFQDINISGRSIREIPEMMTEPIDELDSIKLNYDQNVFSLELLPIGISVSQCKFSWKMEGIDLDWSIPTSLRTVTYTNLPDGQFTFKVRMYDNSFTQIIDERFIHIHIVPPFWRTWWFLLITIVGIVLIVLVLINFYIKHLKQIHAEDKIRFFTNMAHDIRTSLTLINAPIEELNKERNLSESGHYYLNLATEQSDRLTFVATQLLDIQKVDIGKGQLFLTMTDIVKLVRLRIMMFETSARKNQIELVFSTDQESYSTAIDEIKMEKVVDNLLSNAIKYSLSGGKVEVRLNCMEKEWILCVKDYGLGISENAQKKLFREFYRGDNAVNSRMVGSGIGLLLTKNYVSMHQGQISIESKEHVGSFFKIVVPYKIVDQSDCIIADETPTEAQETLATPTIVVEDPNAETQDQQKKKWHLMLVEDNSDLQGFMKHAFQKQYIISTASNGKEAWEMIEKEAPDLVISDIMMPVMDGFEFCRLMKSTFTTSHIPIILLTSLSEKTHELEGLGLGADDYITKPFDMKLLEQRILSIVRNREVVKNRILKFSGKAIESYEPILTNEQNDQFVKRAIEVVQKNMDNSEFGKDDFAKEMFVSTSLLYKKLKSLTGQSPVDFIRTMRINHGMELLRTGKYSITEISEACGFSSATYFGTVFKKHFGKAPSDMFDK